ncbi:MAG: hypothetical protein Q7R96_06210 [Nanoarchaeota archaeon]|nr:hypothetical protein [Nanoarchaeota archaeon]
MVAYAHLEVPIEHYGHIATQVSTIKRHIAPSVTAIVEPPLPGKDHFYVRLSHGILQEREPNSIARVRAFLKHLEVVTKDVWLYAVESNVLRTGEGKEHIKPRTNPKTSSETLETKLP